MRGWLASISLLTAPKLPLPRTTCLHGITSAARWNSNRPKAKQSLGQNFLSDTTIARRIVEGLDDTLGTLRAGDDDGFRVIELGPGQGALTGHLLAFVYIGVPPAYCALYPFPRITSTRWTRPSRALGEEGICTLGTRSAWSS